ncbi:hypothetical protein ACIHAA_06520 [Streptomyces sp. NPDC052040]|uniref:hypothetical protein n=1 Tax=Streptomyces sp. NPDC052040 TaxID=3365682 RepID=UPI0037CFCE57
MRLSRPSRLSLFLPCALAAVLLLRQAPAAALVADTQLSCSGGAGRAFPLTTQIHGGPGSYKPGGADQNWTIDLKNTTAESCKNIHPVVVLVDSQRKLRDAEPHLEFYGGDRWRPVAFTHTDRQELVGAFGGDFPGFTVGPGRTVSVKVHFALSDKARPNDIVAKAAVAQKNGTDGDWAGESNDYWFQIETGDAAADLTGRSADPSATAADPSDKATGPTPTDTTGSPSGASAHPSGTASGKPGKGQAPHPGQTGTPATSPSPALTPTAKATATPSAAPPSRDMVKFIGGLAMAAVGLLVAGGALLMARRRR